jgi:hypothetical protein
MGVGWWQARGGRREMSLFLLSRKHTPSFQNIWMVVWQALQLKGALMQINTGTYPMPET